GQEAVGRAQGVTGADLGDGNVAEGSDTVADGRRGCADQRGAARVGADGQRHARGVGGGDVVELIEQLDGDGRADRVAGDGVGGLHADDHVGGGGGSDAEGG